MAAGRRTVGGTIGGALGAVPFLSVARETAGRLWTPPGLPGALAEARDLKAATYLEVFVLLFLIPASAFFFGVTLPRWLARRSGRGPIRAAPGLAFGISFWLWRSGLGSGASLALACLAALTLAATGSRLGVYALPSMESREALAGIFLKVAAWTLTCSCVGASFALWLLFVACGAAAALARLRSDVENWRPIA